jgi:transposase
MICNVFCAVLYLVKKRCAWRALPHDFPKWENVNIGVDVLELPFAFLLKRWIVERSFG